MSLFGNNNNNQQPSRGLFGSGYQEQDSLPTEVAALQSIINSLQAELKATTSVNTHLAASIARLQAEQPTAIPTSTTGLSPTTTTTPPSRATTDATGHGAASPEVFQRILKTNWHGRLGRAHMVDVDALPPAALMELDSLLRRKLQCIFPHGAVHNVVDAENIFACLASLGLRLEDRTRYVDARLVGDDTICSDSTVKRARTLSAFYHANLKMKHEGYWRGFVLETLVELARYRGLFDDDGYLVVE
ncbi:hypothetical protein DFP73DRAFT_631898 [Morchella snyderi]|nr:hypothetical protein DFP73DRAFT_631898 [Morchella snyderi]